MDLNYCVTLSRQSFDELYDLSQKYSDLDQYADNTLNESYSNTKNKLDNDFCGLTLWLQEQISYSEIKIGNTIIKDNILTCIYDNQIHHYKMIKRNATTNDIVYITQANDTEPFNKEYIGKCYKVFRREEHDEFVVPHAIVRMGYFDEETNKMEGYYGDIGWCLYDDQYVVLDPMKP